MSRPNVDEVYLMTLDGVLISRQGVRPPKRDPDVMAGQIRAIMLNIEDKLTHEEHNGLERARFGKMSLMFRQGKSAVLVAVVRGEPTRRLERAVERCFAGIEASYGAAIQTWQGTEDLSQAMKPILKGLLGKGYRNRRARGGEPA